MTFDDLRLLLAVAEAGSFAAAARRLGLDPSSVSRSVAGLETALGFRLFQRSTRRLAVTEEGAAYLARMAPLLDEAERARDEARALRHRPRGTLRLSCSVAFGHEVIVPRLQALRDALPEVQLDLLFTDARLDLVAEAVDLAIRLGPAPTGDLIATRLFDTHYRICASPGWAAAQSLADPAALAQHRVLLLDLPEHRVAWRLRDPAGAEATVQVAGDIVISNPLTLREACRHGLGPALLADWLVGRDLASGRLVDLFPGHAATATTFETGAWGLYPARAWLPAKVRATLDVLRDSFRRTPPDTSGLNAQPDVL